MIALDELLTRNVAGDWLRQQPIRVKGDNLFPDWVRAALVDPDYYHQGRAEQLLKQFFARESEVCSSVIEEHGTFRITRIAYTGENVMGKAVEGIDRWLWEKPSAQALRDRLEAVCQEIARFLESALRSGQTYRVRDLGGSDAPYFFRTVEILEDMGVEFRNNLRWTVIDQNELAITLGQARATELGLNDVVDFVHASFMKPESFPAVGDEADLLLAIGIVCSLPPQVAVGFLNKAKAQAKMGTKIFVPTLSERSFRDDPESYLVYWLIGWHLWPKSEELVRWIFEAAGLKVEHVGSERPNGGHYHMVWAAV